MQVSLGLATIQESDVNLSFHGADRSVTGSCHLVECAGKRILIDCGLRQGSRDLDAENAEPFGFDAAGIDYLLLTHAHLDHCGRLPLLAKRGFRGEIITTAASRELARLVMLDAAHMQEEESARQGFTMGVHRYTAGILVDHRAGDCRCRSGTDPGTGLCSRRRGG